MIVSKETPRKRHYLFVLAIVILIFGGAALFIWSNNFLIRSASIVACIVSVYLVRISNVHARPSLGVVGELEAESKFAKRPKRMMWIIGVALLAAVGGAFSELYSDALRGYHEVFPVYLFSGAAIVCIAFWSYLISRLL